MSEPLDRRTFLGAGAGAGAALICTIGGERVRLSEPGDAAKADAAARRVAQPAAARVDVNEPNGPFPAPEPAAGGTRREYWIQAATRTWDIIPTGRDDWHDRRISGPRRFRAFAYQPMSPGFADPAGPPTIPGPTLTCEVGDLLVVHFRNADERLGQAVTMHPHGVRYNPEYDGTYLGNFTRAGGFVPPGEEFTYTWEATPDSVGAWPYHDHGPNHTLNTMRGLFGAIVIRPRGAKRPDREYALFMHSLPPQITGRQDLVQCFNGRTGAGNTPTLRAKVGEDVAMHVFGGDGMFHTFHIHGHRWPDHAGVSVDSPTVGPNESITARFVEDNPGRWLYHCHVFSHQDAGMAGWYLVDR